MDSKKMKSILEAMERLEGSLYRRNLLESIDEMNESSMESSENSGTTTNANTNDLSAKSEYHTSTGELAEKEEDMPVEEKEDSEEEIEEAESCKKTAMNESIEVKGANDDSGKTSNNTKGVNAQDTWKMGAEKAKKIMNAMKKFDMAEGLFRPLNNNTDVIEEAKDKDEEKLEAKKKVAEKEKKEAEKKEKEKKEAEKKEKEIKELEKKLAKAKKDKDEKEIKALEKKIKSHK